MHNKKKQPLNVCVKSICSEMQKSQPLPLTLHKKIAYFLNFASFILQSNILLCTSNLNIYLSVHQHCYGEYLIQQAVMRAFASGDRMPANFCVHRYTEFPSNMTPFFVTNWRCNPFWLLYAHFLVQRYKESVNSTHFDYRYSEFDPVSLLM